MMTGEARIDEKAIRVIVDVLVHDINNHIHGSTGYLELLDHVMDDDPTKRRFLTNAISEIRSVSNLVENISLLLNIPREPFRGEPVDLYTVLMTAVEMAAQRFDGKSLELQTTLKHGEIVLNADRFLQNVLTEILANSLKFDHRKEVHVWVSAAMEGGSGIVVIGDQGRGIPDDQKGTAMDRYWRSIEKEDVHGKGMGLSVVKMVVDRYGGTVKLEDRVPGDHTQGTKITLDLPLSK